MSFKTTLDQEACFDLVTFDILMPDMGGIEVLFELSELERNVNIAGENLS